MFVDLIQPYGLNQFYHPRSPVFIPWVSFTSQKPVLHMTRLRNVSQALSTLDTSICFYSQHFALHKTQIKKDSHTLFIVVRQSVFIPNTSCHMWRELENILTCYLLKIWQSVFTVNTSDYNWRNIYYVYHKWCVFMIFTCKQTYNRHFVNWIKKYGRVCVVSNLIH